MKNKKFLICSDVHGNLQALKKVLLQKKHQKPDIFICLGDVIGYGADPEICLKLLKEQNAVILKGNHEAILLGESEAENCSSLGQASSRWTSAHCGKPCREVLSHLPFDYHFGEIDFYHSALKDDGSWPYHNNTEQISAHLSEAPGKFVFYSHTHRPRLTILDNGKVVEDRMILQSETFIIHLQDKRKYIVNVGSVGQQRDTKTDAAFVVFDIDKDGYALHFYRVRYNSFRAYMAIVHRGCGKETAAYLIREPWRRKTYELFDHWCGWLRRR